MYRQLELKFEHLDDLNIKCAPKIRFKGFADDWEQRRLGEISDIIGGGTPSTNIKKYWNGVINWYTPAEIGNQIFLRSSQKKITELGLQNSSAQMLPIGSVLFTSRAGIGNSAILIEREATNQGFQSIVPCEKFLDTYFIFSRTNELKKYGELVGAGSTFNEVSRKQMMSMLILIPELIEQKKIGSFFKTIDDTITIHQRKCEEMEKLNKSYSSYEFSKSNKLFYNLNINDISLIERAKKGKIYKKGSTLIQLSASKGEILYIKKDIKVDPKYAVLIPKSDKHGRYIYISANHDYKMFFRRMVTTINLQFDALSFFNIKVHKDENTIKFICRIYDVIEKYCELLNDYIEILNELKKTLMSKMFV